MFAGGSYGQTSFDGANTTKPTPTYADGARRVAPLALATLFDGLTFGVLATSAGFGVLPALVMSATTFAGSAQFAAASLLGAGGGALAAVTTGGAAQHARDTDGHLGRAGAVRRPARRFRPRSSSPTSRGRSARSSPAAGTAG